VAGKRVGDLFLLAVPLAVTDGLGTSSWEEKESGKDGRVKPATRTQAQSRRGRRRRTKKGTLRTTKWPYGVLAISNSLFAISVKIFSRCFSVPNCRMLSTMREASWRSVTWYREYGGTCPVTQGGVPLNTRYE